MLTNQPRLREINLGVLFNSNLGQKKISLRVGEDIKREYLVRINNKWLAGTFYTKSPHPQILFGPVEWNPSGHELNEGKGWEGIWEIIEKTTEDYRL